MRSFFLLAALLAAPAVAQSRGVWTGYVRGWVDDAPRARWRPAAPLAPAPGWTWSALALRHLDAQALLLQQQEARAREGAVLEASRVALEEQRRALEAQTRALEQQVAAQEQQLVAQQLLAQAQPKEPAPAPTPAPAAATPPAEPAAATPAAQEAPKEKGPDVYRWVDERGVVHYSTKPHAGARKLNENRKNGLERHR